MINNLMHIELKTGYSDDGSAWIGYVKTLKSKKILTFPQMRANMIIEKECYRQTVSPLYYLEYLSKITAQFADRAVIFVVYDYLCLMYIRY